MQNATIVYGDAKRKKIAGIVKHVKFIGPALVRTVKDVLLQPVPSVCLSEITLDELDRLGVTHVVIAPGGESPRWATTATFRAARVIEFGKFGRQHALPLRKMHSDWPDGVTDLRSLVDSN